MNATREKGRRMNLISIHFWRTNEKSQLCVRSFRIRPNRLARTARVARDSYIALRFYLYEAFTPSHCRRQVKRRHFRELLKAATSRRLFRNSRAEWSGVINERSLPPAIARIRSWFLISQRGASVPSIVSFVCFSSFRHSAVRLVCPKEEISSRSRSRAVPVAARRTRASRRLDTYTSRVARELLGGPGARGFRRSRAKTSDAFVLSLPLVFVLRKRERGSCRGMRDREKARNPAISRLAASWVRISRVRINRTRADINLSQGRLRWKFEERWADSKGEIDRIPFCQVQFPHPWIVRSCKLTARGSWSRNLIYSILSK